MRFRSVASTSVLTVAIALPISCFAQRDHDRDSRGSRTSYDHMSDSGRQHSDRGGNDHMWTGDKRAEPRHPSSDRSREAPATRDTRSNERRDTRDFDANRSPDYRLQDQRWHRGQDSISQERDWSRTIRNRSDHMRDGGFESDRTGNEHIRDSRFRGEDRFRDREDGFHEGHFFGGRPFVEFIGDRHDWLDIAGFAGFVGFIGLLEHDDFLYFAGSAGSLYALWRYDEDLACDDPYRHARACYFSLPFFYRDGCRYERTLVVRGGDRFYQFVRCG